MSSISDRFDERIESLPTQDRKRFLHGVYKQLVESHKGRQAEGDYRAGFEQLSEIDRAQFALQVADALLQYGFEAQALRLLEQSKLKGTYARLKQTLAELEQVDSNWRSRASIHLETYGIQIYYGDRRNARFSASIINTPVSFGGHDKSYETMPMFDGKTMEELGLGNISAWSGNTAGWLPLEKAVYLANATLSRDPRRFREASINLYR